MALCKYIHIQGLRQFSVCSQHLCNKPDFYTSFKDVEKPRQDSLLEYRKEYLKRRPWDENFEIMKYSKSAIKLRKENEFSHHRDQLFINLQRLRHILLYKGGLQRYINEKLLERELLRQSYFQERVDILGPDLGAAHFIVNRGGRIKFWGHKDWVSKKNKNILPCSHTPGLYVAAIDATNTGLYYEGVDCLRNLNKLKWLRLRGLTKLNDFSLDIISGRYGLQLEYLDLTGCTGFTQCGFEAFYRFKCLKGLNVTGLENSPEFHLTLLMIQDLLPDLEIIGVDFSQYLKEETKEEILPEIQGKNNDKNVINY